MIFQFGKYKVDIDAEETRRLYETADTVTEGCDCQNCRNFYHAVDVLPQPVKVFFEKLGIDLRRALMRQDGAGKKTEQSVIPGSSWRAGMCWKAKAS